MIKPRGKKFLGFGPVSKEEVDKEKLQFYVKTQKRTQLCKADL